VRHMLERPPSALNEGLADENRLEAQPQAIVTDPRLPPATMAQTSARQSTSSGT